jgi:hypothetical protein
MRIRYLVALSLLAACTRGSSRGEWDAFVRDYLEASYQADPAYAVSLGKHQYDGGIADLSKAGIQREIARLHAARDRAAAFDTSSLSSAQRFERAYLIAVIDGLLFWSEKAGWPWKNPQWYANELDPQVYLTRDYAPLDVRIKAFTKWARAVPAVLEQVKSNLQPPFAPTIADIGRIQ